MFQVSKVDLLSSVDQKKPSEFYENQNNTITRAIPPSIKKKQGLNQTDLLPKLVETTKKDILPCYRTLIQSTK